MASLRGGLDGGSETKLGMFPAQEIHCELSVRCVFDFLESIDILLGSYDILVTKMTGPRITGCHFADMSWVLNMSVFAGGNLAWELNFSHGKE